MPYTAPIHELEFLKATKNHAEHSKILSSLGEKLASGSITLHAHAIASSWLRLACEHMLEAQQLLPASHRAIYSRSYYAAYNASKAVRYATLGLVSLKGDDHRAVSDLPKDFPNLQSSAATLTNLYEDRLRADYDNWTDTASKYHHTPHNARQHASDFLSEAKSYLATRFGITP